MHRALWNNLVGMQGAVLLFFSLEFRGADSIQRGEDKMRANYRQQIICFPDT